MPKGISIHIGLNLIDRLHYGVSGQLPYCDNDTEAMFEIAQQQGFYSRKLINENATSNNVIFGLYEAANELRQNDILFLSYSGHGCFFKDVNNDEKDGSDEAWMLYDKVLVDDQLMLAWSMFRPGVRILVVSDSCHSGTMTKGDICAGNSKLNSRHFAGGQLDALTEVYKRNKLTYDSILKSTPIILEKDIQCSVMLISACQDDQTALAIGKHGKPFSVFTYELLQVWNNGNFHGDYVKLFEMVKTRLRKKKYRQVPNYSVIGKYSQFFCSQRPFTI